MTKIFFLAVIVSICIVSCSKKQEQKQESLEEKSNKSADTISMPEKQIPSDVQKSDNDIKYETYCNGKFSYCIDYPSELLIPQGESGSGDGQVFKSENEANTLTVYRDFRDNINPDGLFNLETAYKEDLENSDRDVTYKKIGRGFYVISGYKGDQIFYQRTAFIKNQLVTVILLYNESDKETYDKVTKNVTRSLKGA